LKVLLGDGGHEQIQAAQLRCMPGGCLLVLMALVAPVPPAHTLRNAALLKKGLQKRVAMH